MSDDITPDEMGEPVKVPDVFNEARVRELEAECERLKAREVVLSDRQAFLHIALTEAGFPDHEGEDETYRSFSLSERVEQMAKALRAAREAKDYWMRQR